LHWDRTSKFGSGSDIHRKFIDLADNLSVRLDTSHPTGAGVEFGCRKHRRQSHTRC
jgi:hypothetical protein